MKTSSWITFAAGLSLAAFLGTFTLPFLVSAIVLWLALFARESYGAAALPGME